VFKGGSDRRPVLSREEEKRRRKIRRLTISITEVAALGTGVRNLLVFAFEVELKPPERLRR